MLENASVRDTLRFIAMVTTTIVLVIACAAFVGADLLTAGDSLAADLESLADVVSENSAAALMFRDEAGALQVLSALDAKPSIVSACVFTNDGEALAVYRSPEAPAKYAPPAAAPKLGTTVARDGIVVVRPIVFQKERVGTLYVASDVRAVTARLKRFGIFASIVLVVGWFLAFVVASRVQRILSLPILELARVADRVRVEQDFTLRPTISSRAPRELAMLSSTIGEMLDGIHERDERLKENRDRLEVEVAARTADLREANVALIRARDEAQNTASVNERLSRHKQAILNTAGEGIFGLTDAGRVSFINTSGARMLGYEPEELLGTRLHDIIHDESLAALPLETCPICSTEMQTRRVDGKSQFVARDGRRFPVEYTAGAMRDDQSGRGVVVTFRDITERLAVERLKDEFVSTVSHELRTPLTSIRGALGLLGSGLLGSASPRAARMLEIAVLNTDRLGRLINDILDLEKMSSGRVELNRKLVSASQLIRDAIDVVQTTADRDGIAIQADPTPDVLLWVDRDRLVQTLTNLLANAVKFSEAGTMVRIGGEQSEKTFTFHVTDRGRGIPADKLEMIFERFKQVDASDSRDKGGSGLGLAICRSIVAAHAGRIWAASREGEGSTFRIELPVAAGVAERDAGSRAILIVSADDASIVSLRAAAERRGYAAVVTAPAEKVVTTARIAAAILVDPDEDVLHRFAGPRAPIDAPVLVATANRESFVAAELVTGWIELPLQDHAVDAALDATLGRPAVLVVEDDPDLARVISVALEAFGVRSLHATCGTDAVEICRRDRPAVVLLDIVLPELDGTAVARWMRDQAELQNVPIVIYSAAELPEPEKSRLISGKTEFFIKSRSAVSEVAARAVALLNDADRKTEEVPGAA
jgi:PAS domain S-box-containing protein